MVLIKARKGALNEAGAVSKTVFVGSKVSRVRYLNSMGNNVDVYVSATWDGQKNRLSLLNVYNGGLDLKDIEYFYKRNDVFVTDSINDVFVEAKNTVVAGLENGTVEVCQVASNAISRVNTFHNVHKGFSSTSIVVCDGEIISGSDSGDLMRMDLTGASQPSVLSTGLSAVHCTTNCGPFEFVSGHGTGQIHLWDLRQVNPTMVTGETPISSKHTGTLLDAVTAIASHPSQPNVLAFGIQSGSVAFMDIRNTRAPIASFLKLSKFPISDLKFHPSFGGNCFALSNESLLHLDVMETRHTKTSVPYIENRQVNAWLTTSAWNSVDLNTLLSEEPKLLTSFDLSSRSILVSSDTGYMTVLTRMQFR
ncbi:unnamed protein product [Bursaphelenchus xylophilus]|uniref:(pine wood nematode) hypothetical protein n=1 Tax=Bursaphelenchus xylophilus TaxID=6326 RepID=A0A1I7RM26_BURXY|nr:unnamed protein product [Bursaphelenchus xylophilus]CAG9118143.1 unnamed protein product [Bursaphelenchus xylophilus]